MYNTENPLGLSKKNFLFFYIFIRDKAYPDMSEKSSLEKASWILIILLCIHFCIYYELLERIGTNAN